MDRTASASRLLDLLLPQWHELLQGWALDGSISGAAQDSLCLDGVPPLLGEVAIRLVSRGLASDHTICWPAGSARHRCSSSWAAGCQLDRVEQ